MTGGYQIDSPTFNSETGIVPKEQIGGLVNVDSDGLLWQSTVTLYGTAVLMLLLFAMAFPGACARASATPLRLRTKRCHIQRTCPRQIIRSSEPAGKMATMRFLHTMLRVGNLQRSIDFYTNVIGMQLLRKSENPEYKYSLAFLGFEGGNPGQAEIELTYNWGTESYDMGTAYGHIALGVPDAYAACEKIKAAGGNVTREAGPVKGGSTVIAFVTDPDGYKIELIQRKDDLGTGTGLR